MWDTIKEVLQSRGVQLLSRYAGIGLLFLAGKVGVTFEASQVESMSSGLSLLIVSAILLLADHFIHAKNEAAK
jgi:hypothetical protein